MKNYLNDQEKELLLEAIRQKLNENPLLPQQDVFPLALEACGLTGRVGTYSSICSHYVRRAKGIQSSGASGEKQNETVSAYEKIHTAERAIKDALKDLDNERNALHQRIIELDNMIAKYKKLI